MVGRKEDNKVPPVNGKAQASRKSLKRFDLLRFAFIVLVVVLVNLLGQRFYTRLDLTAEKRYTLSKPTRQLIRDLDDVVFFKVYLEGDFPAGFKQLSRATREMLDEFRAVSDKIEYEFINPSASNDVKIRNQVYRQLSEKGLVPTTLQVREKDGSAQRIIFPGALVTYKGREVALPLLQSQIGVAPEQVLNNAVKSLEYNLANAIRKLSQGLKPKLAVLEGYGQLPDTRLWDGMTALNEFYSVERIVLGESLGSLAERVYNEDSTEVRVRNKYAVVIIPKPTQAWSEKDKFILDQFIMRGGKVLWMIDAMVADMDSLQARPEMVSVARDVNLGDMLFRYGVRVNPDLLMDMRAMPIPVKTGQIGDQPQFEFYPWYYMPLIASQTNHPAVVNLNASRFEFVSSIDTVESEGVRKTILLETSAYTRVSPSPAYVTLEILKKEPDQKMFPDGPRAVAVLLEGEFTSLFRNRIPPEIEADPGIGYRDMSLPTRMIVLSDGDVFSNQVSPGTRTPLPLGYDQYTGETLGNRDLLLNLVNYLTDESGLIQIRSRELRLRTLDQARVNAEKNRWQVINVLIPVLLVILFGLGAGFLRKRRYSR